MLLRCDCHNTSADALYGKGWREHAKLNPRRPHDKEVWMCGCCYWVRTKEQGLTTGKK